MTATQSPAKAVAAVHVFSCPTCKAQPEVTSEMGRLPCGHFTAFRTQSGAVIFWQDTGAMTLNLERVLKRPEFKPAPRLTPAAAAGD